MYRTGTRIYSDDFKSQIGFGTVGRDAYKVSPVWKLGVRIFKNDGTNYFRVNYLRTRKATHYFQIGIRDGKKNYHIRG